MEVSPTDKKEIKIQANLNLFSYVIRRNFILAFLVLWIVHTVITLEI